MLNLPSEIIEAMYNLVMNHNQGISIASELGRKPEISDCELIALAITLAGLVLTACRTSPLQGIPPISVTGFRRSQTFGRTRLTTNVEVYLNNICIYTIREGILGQ